MIVAYTHCLRQKLLPLADLQSFIILQSSTDGKMNLRKKYTQERVSSTQCLKIILKRSHTSQYAGTKNTIKTRIISKCLTNNHVLYFPKKVSKKETQIQGFSKTRCAVNCRFMIFNRSIAMVVIFMIPFQGGKALYSLVQCEYGAINIKDALMQNILLAMTTVLVFANTAQDTIL